MRRRFGNWLNLLQATRKGRGHSLPPFDDVPLVCLMIGCAAIKPILLSNLSFVRRSKHCGFYSLLRGEMHGRPDYTTAMVRWFKRNFDRVCLRFGQSADWQERG